MDIKKIEKILSASGQPAWRAKQVKEAYFKNLLDGWDDLSVLPKDLRGELSGSADWDTITFLEIKRDEMDGTEKALFKIEGGSCIETVLIKHKDGRRTVCVSSQSGCPLGCVFCATGQSGYKRNLTRYEIADQAVFFARRLHSSSEKISNIVFMGMGEPFMNYEEVMGAVRILNDPKTFGLGARNISISTVGMPDRIKKFAEEDLQVNLAFSLHAPNDELRSSLVPFNKKHNIEKVIKALDSYVQKTKRRVMVEYILLGDVNDSANDAKQLAALLSGKKLYMLNLIPYNSTGKFKKSPAERIKKFIEILEGAHISVTLRHEFGSGIWGACGQLAGK
jgi:23S rRNA (adenine2503-C2)-methyltransferase